MGRAVEKSRSNGTTVYDHIRELQLRIVISAVSMVAAGIVVYIFHPQILSFLSSPLAEPLYYNSPAGGFSFIMKICVAGALIVTVPVIFYNIIMFIRPAVKELLSMKRVLFVTITSTILAISGAAFAYYCILPGSLTFFKGFRVSGLSALISADSYLSFLTSMVITFVLIFQIPLIMGFIDTIKPLSPRQLLRLEKWVVIGSLVVALLAPFTYDFVTSILIAVPIIVLYNLSILLVCLQHVRRKAKNKNKESVVFQTAKQVSESEKSNLLNNVDTSPSETCEETIEITKSIPNNRSFMDIKVTTNRPQPITQVAWMKERSVSRPLTRPSNLITDIRPNRKSIAF